MKPQERAAARALRRDEGLPLGAIAARLGVAKSSVSVWTRDIELTADQHEALRALNPLYNNQLRGHEARRASARAARAEAQRHGRELARRADPLHLTGCMLYWAEGSKSRNAVEFVNSDRVSVASRRRRGNVLPYGTARLVVHSTFVVQSIYGAIQEYGGFDRPAWID